ncbi:MAG: DUF1834 family protein [Burkholderiales bacterium]|nr:DUF1834 family protein [Burkholderiales bacterium]
MSIRTIEDNLIATIKTIVTDKVRSVDSLPGDWDDDVLRRLLRLMPGVFVVFAGGAPERAGGTSAQLSGVWIVYVATAHASGEAARRRGDGRQVGAYELLELLVPRLHGHTVPGEGTLSFARVENLYNGAIDKQGVSVYAATFNMPMALPSDLDLPTLDDFETFAAHYDIPPHESGAEHRKWLEGDYTTSNADAKDEVAVAQD